MNVSSSVQEPQAAKAQDEEQSDPVGKDSDPQRKNSLEACKKPSDDCLVPVSVYWYVNHIYKEEMKHIMKENGVEMEAHVNVKFKAKQKDGNPEGALSEFTQLVQNSLSQCQGSVIPLRFVDPDQWSDAMKSIQDNETKLLITLSSEEVTVFGPAQSQNEVSRALNAAQKRNPSLHEYRPAPQDTSPKIPMTIKDPLAENGLTLEESHWKVMKSTRAEELSKIKKKFGVKLRESIPSQGKINVRASSLGPGGNASLESPVVRALLHLYQKTATLSPRSAQTYGATGFSQSVRKDSDTQRKNSLQALENLSDDCLVSVGDYWYVSHIYKEEIKCIMKKNRVRIEANVNVKIKADQEDGNPEGALSEFTKLVQSSLPNSEGSVIPLKFVDPDQWSDAMRVIQENRSKLLLTLSCEEVTLCGPSQSQDAFSAALNAVQKRNASPKENKPALRDTALRTEKAIKGPSTHPGLTMKVSHLKPSTTSVNTPANARVKFVDFSTAAKPKRESERKASTELLHHVTTALMSSLRNSNILFETQGSLTQHYKKAPTGDGATAGDNEEEYCPICLGPFVDKKQLNCKHEFCYKCLQVAKKHNGPMCPLCKDVFGVMEGDQPDGTMTWTRGHMPLPGFSDCGHILITYYIPSGVQTKKHPNPGQYFHGTSRIAYLPDNKEGNEVLRLLKKAFDQKLIFTVGASRTTGAENQVTWNDIHHKTSIYGYPDPDYLKRVKDELKAKGIK